jgi:hypothetical protein
MRKRGALCRALRSGRYVIGRPGELWSDIKMCALEIGTKEGLYNGWGEAGRALLISAANIGKILDMNDKEGKSLQEIAAFVESLPAPRFFEKNR